MSFRPAGEVLHAVLDQAVITLTERGLAIPDRRYVAGGGGAQDVAWDCEQLAVCPVQIPRGDVARAGQAPVKLTGQRGTGALVRVLQLEIQFVRCYPTLKDGGRGRPQAPSAEDLGAAGDRLADDIDGIAYVLDACSNEGLGTPPGMPNMITLGPVAAVGPEGGFIATVGSLTVSLMQVP